MAATERTITIDVRKEINKVPPYRRAKKAVIAVRKSVERHMKSKDVRLGKYLNLKLWEKGIKHPVHVVTVIAKKDDKGVVTVELSKIPVQRQKSAKVKKAKAAVTKEPKSEATAKVAPPQLPAEATPKEAAEKKA
ncbi:60S ribosomal protein L31 [Candidatus Woesearchaeota archaeon]|nr:60S ribosomal protein L31 [Candidatus Woesearchaeota archaeon]